MEALEKRIKGPEGWMRGQTWQSWRSGPQCSPNDCKYLEGEGEVLNPK